MGFGGWRVRRRSGGGVEGGGGSEHVLPCWGSGGGFRVGNKFHGVMMIQQS